jgi:hypothetical protein
VHETTFRNLLSRVLSDHPQGKSLTEPAFCLITAVCAKVAYFSPSDIFEDGADLAELFLNASRDSLKSYSDYDLENPDANSIIIRYLHSNCLHTSARRKLSWHVFGEAIRLTQLLRLQDESSLENLPPIEAELRRRAFWLLYTGDKSLSMLTNMPITMHECFFDKGITTAYASGAEHE